MNAAITLTRWLYPHVVRPVFFQLNPERVHGFMTWAGEQLGRSGIARDTVAFAFRQPQKITSQSLWGIEFSTPFGLAAGFDYEARLTEFLPSLGFGFQSIGTISNLPSEGNPSPRLGRLPKSRALMVNKGFRNPGVRAVIKKLKTTNFPGPVGISIGQTNSPLLATIDDAMLDIISAFQVAEASQIPFAYYELNISCPNLNAPFTFYDPAALAELLEAVAELGIRQPILVKMPISVSDAEFRQMLGPIVRSKVSGIIVGNLQKDRTHPSLVAEEVARFPRGNFSGRPTQARSEELIRFAYRETGGTLPIVGCGGIFTADDAYRKIRAGASLIQLITGLIYEGPQLVSQLNTDLAMWLQADGFATISEAVGSDTH